MLQGTIGNQATLRYLTQRLSDLPAKGPAELHEQEAAPENMTGREASRGPSWDFSKIPVFPSGRANRPQPPSSLAATLPGAIPAKLAVGQANDPLEHEADRIADQVMRMPDPEVRVASAPPHMSRKCEACEHEDNVQRKEAGPHPPAGEAPGIVHQVLRLPGQSLDPASRAYFEPRFRHDFSSVRVHTDQRAVDAARVLAARAFTVGEHIVFGANEYAPGGANGARLLAHELTHVVQQSGGGDTLRRDNKTDPPELRTLDRPGAKWPFGPVTKHKSIQHDLFDYVLAVKHVERAYGPDKQSVLQRLRRLYYSSFSGKGEYERVIAEQAGAGVSSDPPLDAQMIGTAAIDFLYETNVLKLPDGELIDVSHVLAALDVKTSGLTFKAARAEEAVGIKWLGVVTWAGDLASWMANYIEKDRSSPEGPPQPADPAPQKVVLISDMDGQILAEENVRRTTPAAAKAEGRVARDPNIGTELSMPVSELLDNYFGIGKGTTQPQNLRNRFDKFVRIATPRIPHRGTNPDGSGPVMLTAEAPDAIYDAIYNTAWLFVVHGTSYSYGTDVLARYTPHFREVARRFAQFLTTGLAKGDAPWPGIKFNP